MNAKEEAATEKALAAVNAEAWSVVTEMNDSLTKFKAKSLKREDADTITNMCGKKLKALSTITGTIDSQRNREYALWKMGAIDGAKGGGGTPALATPK